LKNGVLIGVVVGVLFSFISIITGLNVIALPSVPQSISAFSVGIIVIVVAPIVEELFFRWFLIGQQHFPFYFAAALFTGFHYFAYSLIGGVGAFFSSFIFAIVMYFLMNRFGILASVFAHATVNAYILYGSRLLIG